MLSYCVFKVCLIIQICVFLKEFSHWSFPIKTKPLKIIFYYKKTRYCCDIGVNFDDQNLVFNQRKKELVAIFFSVFILKFELNPVRSD